MSRLIPLFIATLGVAGVAGAATPRELLDQYVAEARSADPTAAPLASRGERFFHTAAKDWSCATCHTADPRAVGRHAVTSRSIQPLAPAANAERFTDPARVEKWFRRNCGDVLGRPCTAAEKADVIAYLVSLPGKA